MYGCETSHTHFVSVMMNSPNLLWALGGVKLMVCHCVHGPCQSLYIEGGRFMSIKNDFEVVGRIAMWGGSHRKDRYVGRNARTGVVVNLKSIGCLRVIPYRPQLQYWMMKYKGELAFSLYYITSFLIEHRLCGQLDLGSSTWGVPASSTSTRDCCKKASSVGWSYGGGEQDPPDGQAVHHLHGYVWLIRISVPKELMDYLSV